MVLRRRAIWLDYVLKYHSGCRTESGVSLLSVNTGYWLGIWGEITVVWASIDEEEMERMGKSRICFGDRICYCLRRGLLFVSTTEEFRFNFRILSPDLTSTEPQVRHLFRGETSEGGSVQLKGKGG